MRPGRFRELIDGTNLFMQEVMSAPTREHNSGPSAYWLLTDIERWYKDLCTEVLRKRVRES